MHHNVESIVCTATGASACYFIENIQSLWSGYGKIMRYGLKGVNRDRVVVKYVTPPDQRHHPRGWNSDLSHQRKVKSYQVESAWYSDWSRLCNAHCRVPECLALESFEGEFLFVLEDMDASGFSIRKQTVSLQDMQACLTWLANFHATFLGKTPRGLWEVGSYWHIDTRPDELAALQDVELKNAAGKIDQLLRSGDFQTIIHGDAKLANFCFSEYSVSKQCSNVAAVDFQYVGGGCGMKDVAYFIGSCLDEADCEYYETDLLDCYFSALQIALKEGKGHWDIHAIEREWRDLYAVAWTDFHRFLKGWSPEHWKIHSYSERLARKVIAQLNSH